MTTTLSSRAPVRLLQSEAPVSQLNVTPVVTLYLTTTGLHLATRSNQAKIWSLRTSKQRTWACTNVWSTIQWLRQTRSLWLVTTRQMYKSSCCVSMTNVFKLTRISRLPSNYFNSKLTKTNTTKTIFYTRQIDVLLVSIVVTAKPENR